METTFDDLRQFGPTFGRAHSENQSPVAEHKTPSRPISCNCSAEGYFLLRRLRRTFILERRVRARDLISDG
jgi:hypothetical protein